MIVRILGTGQYYVDDSDLPTIESADDAVEAALAAGDAEAFSAALRGLIETIADTGTPIDDDDFRPSDVIVPDADTTLEEASGYIDDAEEGLIPG